MALDVIPDPNSHNNAGTERLTFDDLLDLYKLIDSHGSTPAHKAICAVIVRLLEMGFLHDRDIQRIGSLWTSLGQTGKVKLSDRISKLTKGEEIPDELLNYMSNILAGSAFQRGRRKVNYNDYFESLVRDNVKRRRRRRLTCDSCGYHFMLADLGRERQEIARDCGAEFSKGQHEFRKNNHDRLKPLFYEYATPEGNKKTYLTQLTIDHKIPEEGLGWSDEDNLQITCKLCNVGKLAYRRPLEAISLFAAGGLADFPDNREWNTIMQSVVSSTFEYYNRKCVSCGRSTCDVELTAREFPASSHEVGELHLSFAPWNLRAICYECLERKGKLRI